MISKNAKLFSIKQPLVAKDLVIENDIRNSYKDTIARKWKDFKPVKGGLLSVIKVLNDAFDDAKCNTQYLRYKIFKKIYCTTFPFWIIDYKSNNVLLEAFGLIVGVKP